MFPIEPRPLAVAGQNLEIGGFAVTTTRADHGATETLALRLAARGGAATPAIAISSDTAPAPGVLDLSRGVSLLFHECSVLAGPPLPAHTALEQVDDLARGTDARRIVLVHLPPVDAAVERGIRVDLARRHGGRVTLGEDGQVFEI
jgi:ribonuclease BN (tRNA processing enzyme)